MRRLFFLVAALLALGAGDAYAQKCPVGQTVAAGTTCGISDYSVGGAMSVTDAFLLCQLPGGCHSPSATVTTVQGNGGQILSLVRGNLSAVAPITYNSSTGAFGLAIDSTLSVSGGQLHVVSGGGGSVTSITCGSGLSCSPNPIVASGTISATGGGGGSGTVGSGTAPQAAYYQSTGTTVIGNPNVSYQTGFTRLNYMTSLGSIATPVGGTLLQLGGSDGSAPRVELDSFGTQGKYDVNCAGGTGASPTGVTSGTQCGGYDALAYNGSSYVGPLAGVGFWAAENQSSGHGGMFTTLSATPVGSTTPVIGLQLNADGGVTVPAGVAGGSKGPGTINMTGCFINGVACSGGSITIPNAALLSGNGSSLGSVALGSNLSISGTFPTQTLNATAGSGTPGGSNTQAQFNSSGTFGGSSGLTLSTTKVTSASLGLGSDATGDLYYNGGSGTLTRLGIGSSGQVLTVSGGVPHWQSSSGGTPSLWTGNATGTNSYAMTSVQGGFTNAAYARVCAIFTNPSTAGSSLNVDAAGALPIDVQNASGAVLGTVGGEIPGGGTEACFIVSGARSAFIRDTTFPGHITRNFTSPHAVTLGEWQNGETFVCDASSSGCTLTLPTSTTVSPQGGINIMSSLVVPTLTPQSGDGINGQTVGTSQPLSPDLSTSVTTTGVAGVNAFQVAVGKPELIDMTWTPGMDLTHGVTTGVTLRSSRGGAHLVTGIKCTPDVAVGVPGATLEFWYAPSGTAITSGTRISASAAFDANGTLATEVQVPLNASATSIAIPANNRIGYNAAGGGWAGPSTGAGACTLTVL